MKRLVPILLVSSYLLVNVPASTYVNQEQGTNVSSSATSSGTDYATKRITFRSPPAIKKAPWDTQDGMRSSPPYPDGGITYDSAAQAVKITFGKNAGENVGYYEANFGAATATDFPTQFGPEAPAGNEFFIQWQQKFDPNYLGDKSSGGGGGHKQIIVTNGDNKNAKGQTAWSAACMESQIVVGDLGYAGFPRVYHSCGYWDHSAARLYEGLYPEIGNDDRLYQNAGGCAYSDVSRHHDKSHCIQYYPNEWMTFQLHVKVPSDYSIPAEYGGPLTDDPNDRNYHHNATIELWVAREKQPARLAVSLTDLDLAVHIVDPDGSSQFNPSNYKSGYPGWLRDYGRVARYGKILLTGYDTGRSQTWADPTGGGGTWYTNLFIGTRRFPDPGVTAPNAPDSLGVRNNGTGNILIWRDNSDVKDAVPPSSYEIQRCAGWKYDCDHKQSWQTVTNPPFASVCAHILCTYTDNSQGTNLFSYRVRANNNGGSSSWTNTADNLPGWLQDVKATATSATTVSVAWALGTPKPIGGIRVQRCPDVYTKCRWNSAWTNVCQALVATATSCTDNTVTANTTYTYHVLKPITNSAAKRHGTARLLRSIERHVAPVASDDPERSVHRNHAVASAR